MGSPIWSVSAGSTSTISSGTKIWWGILYNEPPEEQRHFFFIGNKKGDIYLHDGSPRRTILGSAWSRPLRSTRESATARLADWGCWEVARALAPRWENDGTLRERGSLWPDEPPGDDWAAAWACGFGMLETDQAAGILGFIGWWTLAWQQSCLRPIIAPGATGRGSQPSNASPQLPRFLKMWPRTGSRSRPSGRSTYLLHDESPDQGLMSARQTRSTRRTCCFFPMTAFPGVKRCTNMLSQSLTSPAATRRLSLLLARPQQRSPMPCLASTNGGLWSGPNCCRPTLGENSWARQASFWQNTGFLLGVVVWIFTGTKPF